MLSAGSLPYVRRPARPSPPPLDVDSVRVIGGVTLLWFVAFCVLLGLPGVVGRIWLWTCLAGWVLGLIGLLITRVQQRAAARRAGVGR